MADVRALRPLRVFAALCCALFTAFTFDREVTGSVDRGGDRAAPRAVATCAADRTSASACGQLSVTLEEVHVDLGQFSGSIKQVSAKAEGVDENGDPHEVDSLDVTLFQDRNNNNAPDEGEVTFEGSIEPGAGGPSARIQIGGIQWASHEAPPKIQLTSSASNGAVINITKSIGSLQE